MDTKSDGSAVGILILVGLLAWAAHSGWFYQTGQQWFDTCWSAQNLTDGPKTPEEALARGQCKYNAEKALFAAGFVFSGNPEFSVTPELKATSDACPSNYKDVPIAGPQILVVNMIQERGGVDRLDSFLPASRLIVRTFESRWPSCPAVREANGFPKIVEKNGEFDWATKCKPCEAEQTAINRH